MSSTDLLALVFALGSSATAQRLGGPALARAAALSAVAGGWSAYRNDAGAGDVGPAHETVRSAGAVQATDDPRRHAFLLWIADHADQRIADAARTIATMVGANRRFDAAERRLLDAALDAVAIGADRAARRVT
jgi:hypothetical protein